MAAWAMTLIESVLPAGTEALKPLLGHDVRPPWMLQETATDPSTSRSTMIWSPVGTAAPVAVAARLCAVNAVFGESVCTDDSVALSAEVPEAAP